MLSLSNTDGLDRPTRQGNGYITDVLKGTRRPVHEIACIGGIPYKLNSDRHGAHSERRTLNHLLDVE